MLEWLKGVLGDSYTEDIDRRISAEVGRRFVSKADFNTVNSTKKQLAENLKKLKEASIDGEDLKNQIELLRTENERIRIDAVVDAALVSAGAKNTKAVKALLNLEGAKLGDDGSVKGLEAQLKSLQKSEDASFLFDDTDDKAPGIMVGKSTEAMVCRCQLCRRKTAWCYRRNACLPRPRRSKHY